MKKVVISAGGTGGHLFPAQELARDLIKQGITEEILFVGGGLAKNKYFKTDEFDHKEVHTATFTFKKPHRVLLGGMYIAKGVLKSCKVLAAFRPDVVIGFGSFYTLPVLLAAMATKQTIVLHEQNVSPGKVNRLLSRFVAFSAITFPNTHALLSGKTIQCALPIQQTSAKSPALGLSNNRLTLLIFGGSQGAKAINQLFFEAIDVLQEKLPSFQVIHLTGSGSETKRAQKLYEKKGIASYVADFEPYMKGLYEKADVAISRAGAGSIAERLAFNLPGVLIPYPLASEDHQTKNAEFFVHTVGGGTLLKEKQSCGEELALQIEKSFVQLDQHKEKIATYRKHHTPSTFTEALIQHL